MKVPLESINEKWRCSDVGAISFQVCSWHLGILDSAMVRKYLGHRHCSTVQIRGYPRKAGSAAYGRAYMPLPYKDFRVIIFFTEFFWEPNLIYTDENCKLINFTFPLLYPHFKAWIIHKISDT